MSDSEEKQYVIFRLGNETFGIDINNVKEIIIYQEPTHIPRLPNSIEGIVNLRGRVIPILNLRKQFDVKEIEKAKNTRIVVVEINDNNIGLVVDEVCEVLMISPDIIEKPSLISSNVDAAFIKGVAKTESNLVILLDLDKVINFDIAEIL